jgi:hypothetical protein
VLQTAVKVLQTAVKVLQTAVKVLQISLQNIGNQQTFFPNYLST